MSTLAGLFTYLTNTLNTKLMSFGFILLLVSGLIKLLKPEKLNNKETANLFHKGLNYMFILSLVIIFATVLASLAKNSMQSNVTEIHQTVKNNQGDVNQAGGNISSGTQQANPENGSANTENQTKDKTESQIKKSVIKQEVNGNTGTLNQSGGDINVK